MASKRQTTMAKIAREQAVRERRARKQEKKDDKKQAAAASRADAASTLYLFLRKHNCHVRRCWRLAWHPHPDHGHPVCRRHHPDGRGVPA